MSKLDESLQEVLKTAPEALSVALDEIGIGMFRAGPDGQLIAHNDTAAAIFGLNSESSWEEKNLQNQDSVLSTGLAGQFNRMLTTRVPLVRRSHPCTNSQGRYLVLDLSCAVLTQASGERREIIGIVRDSYSSLHAGDENGLTSRLRILTEVAEALSSSRSLAQILKVILTGATASQGLGFNRAFLFLYDETQDRLRGHLAVGPSSPEEAGTIWRNLDALRLSLSDLLELRQNRGQSSGDGLTQLIEDLSIDLKQDSIVRDVCKRPRWANIGDDESVDMATLGFLDRLGTRRAALVPLVSKGRLMGLVAADNRITSHPIADGDVEMLQTLANQAAVAMERAALYDAQMERTRELERTNQLLAESQDRIIQIEKMSVIGELTSAVAHELRNPLTVIGGFANLMLQSSVPDDQRECLNIIAGEARRTEQVLDQLLDFYRASKRDKQRLDFHELVRDNLRLLMGRLNRPDLNLTLLTPPAGLTIWGNYDQLSHAVYQLLHVVADEIIPPGSATIRFHCQGQTAVLTIDIHNLADSQDRVARALKHIFDADSKSERLTVLVAAETIRHHGGDLGVALGADGTASLWVELPQSEEVVT